MTHEELHELWEQYVDGKSVALVAGHDDIQWEQVNEADIVVRVNNHWLRQGGRCDVVFYSCAMDIGPKMFRSQALYKEAGLKWAWLNVTHQLFGEGAGCYDDVSKLAVAEGVNCPSYFHGPPRAFLTFAGMANLPPRHLWSKDCANMWSLHPLTGMLALYKLVLSKARSIYVDGMTFYRLPTGELPVKAGAHNIPPQVQMLKDLALDKRLVLSPLLKSLVDKDQRFSLDCL